MPTLTKEQIQEALNRGVSSEDIKRYIQTGSTSASFDLGKAIKNIPSSAGRMVGDIYQAVSSPIETGKSLIKTAVGGLSKLRTEIYKGTKYEAREQELKAPLVEEERAFEGLVGFYKDRYGSIDNIKRTIEEDPVGFVADLSDVLTLGAAPFGETKAGAVIGKIGRAIDPTTLGIRGVSAALDISAGKRIAPFVKDFDIETARLASQYGVEFPATAMSKSDIVRLAETAVTTGPFGTKIKNKLISAGNRISDIAENVTKTANKIPDLEDVGKAIARSADDMRDTWIAGKNYLYDQVKGSPNVSTPNTLKFVNEIVNQKKLSVAKVSDLKWFETLQTGLQGRMTLNKVRATLTEINSKIKNWNDPISTGNNAALKKIAASLVDDLDISVGNVNPALRSALDAANTYYKSGLEVMNTSWFKKIVKNADNPEKIYKAIIKPNSVTDTSRIMELVRPNVADDIRALFMDDALRSLRTPSGTLKVQGLQQFIGKWGLDTVDAILTPQQITALKGVEKAISEIDALGGAYKLGEQIVKGGNLPTIVRLFGHLAAFSVNPWYILRTIVGDYAFSKFISSSTGQKLLTEGIEIPSLNIKKLAPGAGRIISPLRQAGRITR